MFSSGRYNWAVSTPVPSRDWQSTVEDGLRSPLGPRKSRRLRLFAVSSKLFVTYCSPERARPLAALDARTNRENEGQSLGRYLRYAGYSFVTSISNRLHHERRDPRNRLDWQFRSSPRTREELQVAENTRRTSGPRRCSTTGDDINHILRYEFTSVPGQELSRT